MPRMTTAVSHATSDGKATASGSPSCSGHALVTTARATASGRSPDLLVALPGVGFDRPRTRQGLHRGPDVDVLLGGRRREAEWMGGGGCHAGKDRPWQPVRLEQTPPG